MAGDYERRLIRVLDHIHDNPAGDLSLDTLADVAAMSRFHWHRVFHAMTGETCAQAVRRIRMNRAACWLVQRDWPIDEVAKRAGYPNRQSFSRVFTESYGLPPAAFRKSGSMRPLIRAPGKGTMQMYDVTIEERAAMRLAGVPHKGAYLEIGKAFETVGAIFEARGFWGQARGMAGLYYDDPTAVAEADLRSFAGCVVCSDLSLEEPLQEKQVEGGRHARLLYTGPYAGLKAAYDYLYGDWLPGSGEEPADQPCVEVYLNSPMDTAPEELKTEICVPLK